MKVKLSPKTAKGKQRIQRDGNTWFIERVVSGPMPFAPTDKGPWIFISSEKNGDSRWVRQSNDRDFFVED